MMKPTVNSPGSENRPVEVEGIFPDLRIYLFDDDKDFLERFEEWLTKLSYNIRNFRSAQSISLGLDMLRAAPEGSMNLCFVDLLFGGEDLEGLEAINEMLEIDPHAMIVVLTSDRRRDTYVKAYNTGAVDFRLKSEVKSERAVERIIMALSQTAFHVRKLQFEDAVREIIRSTQTFIHDVGKDLTSAVRALAALRSAEAGVPLSTSATQTVRAAADNLAACEAIFSDYQSNFYELGRTATLNECPPSRIMDALARHYEPMFPGRLMIKCVDGRYWLDEAKIFRVLRNLVDNAIKFSPEGTVIEIECQLKRDGVREVGLASGAWLLLTVRDYGYGVQEESKGDIMKYSIRGTNCGDKMGLGLGLWCSERLAAAHRMDDAVGVIDYAEAKPGGGTIFYVALPIGGQESVSEASR